MNLLVPLKMVPDLVEELTLNEAGTDLDRDALTYKLNEFDDQALEEALELKALHGGTVIVAGLDTPDIDQVFYTAIAKGADRAVKITGQFDPLVDSWTAAAAMAPVVASLEVDLVLAGVQAPDEQFGHTRNAANRPTRSRGRRAVTRPWWSITAVAPVLVARSIGRWNSSVRMRDICRCWSIAMVLPNHAMLLRLAKIVGAVAASRKRSASSSPNRSS